MPDYDVLIVGGGPVGAATALALRGASLAVSLLEVRAPRATSLDPRPIALSHGSRLILQRLGVWDALQPATPIERIHVSQQGGFGRVELDAGKVGLPALGYVVDYGRLATALAQALDEDRDCRVIRAQADALETGVESVKVHFDAGRGQEETTARLVAVADGGVLVAPARRREYQQTVVTTRVECELPHRNVAYERFTPQGPLALLPMNEMLAVVWTTMPDHAQELCEISEAAFLERLQTAFGGRLGKFYEAGARSRYSLALSVAGHTGQSRVVAVGNAAQTLHPVAGQGLNLGLRDAWELATLVREGDRARIGDVAQLERYRTRRRLDRNGGIGFTDALVRLFSNDIAPLGLARGLGLAALGAIPPLRDFVVRRMTFGTRG